MRVTASAVDSVGVRAQQIYVAEPDLRTLSVISTAPVLINGITRTSAKVVAQVTERRGSTCRLRQQRCSPAGPTEAHASTP